MRSIAKCGKKEEKERKKQRKKGVAVKNLLLIFNEVKEKCKKSLVGMKNSCIFANVNKRPADVA